MGSRSVGDNIIGIQADKLEVNGNFYNEGRGKQSSPKPPPFRNPAAHFVGREDELKQIAELLLAPTGGRHAWIVGLTGSGGIGKSALAFQFAELHQADFPGGVFSSQVNGKDVAAVAREFARKAGEPVLEDDDSSATAIMEAVFAWRRALLIFDNAESTEIRALLPGGQCAVLITSRDRRLPVFIGGELLELPPLPEPEARVLLSRFVNEKRLQAEPEAADYLLEVTGNLPLAVEIAGKFLKNNDRKSLKEYADGLGLARLTLVYTEKQREDKNLSVRVCFNESVRLLEEEEQGRALVLAFAKLAACAQNGFALSTAAAAMNEPDSAAMLDDLRNYSLLNYAGESGSRFFFHPLLHEFAGELAKERGLLHEARERHAAHFARLLESNAGNELTEDADDLVRAAAWAAENWEYAWAFYLKLKPIFDRLGRWEEGERTAALFLRRAEQEKDAETAAQFQLQQAKFRLIKGDFAQAEALLRQADELIQSVAPEEKRAHLQAMQLNSLGGVFQRQGKFDEAVSAFSKSAKIGETLGDQRHLAMVLNSLGGVFQRQGQFDRAFQAFKKSFEIREEQKDQQGLAMVLNSLGGVYQSLGQFDRAVTAFTKSAEIGETLGDQRHLAVVYGAWGHALLEHGQLNAAIAKLERSFVIKEKMKDKVGLAIITPLLCNVLRQLGRHSEAHDVCQRALIVAPDNIKLLTLHKWHQAMALNSLGREYQHLGQFDKAVTAFTKSAEIGEMLGAQQHLAIVYGAWGHALLAHGQPNAAITKLERSFTILDEKLKNKAGLAIVTPLLCQALQQSGRNKEAAAFCNRALAVAPGNAKLLALQKTLEQPQLTGTVKFISPAKDGGHSFGYITMDDGGDDVRVDSRYMKISGLSKGARVAVEMRTNRYGVRMARSVTVIAAMAQP